MTNFDVRKSTTLAETKGTLHYCTYHRKCLGFSKGNTGNEAGSNDFFSIDEHRDDKRIELHEPRDQKHSQCYSRAAKCFCARA